VIQAVKKKHNFVLNNSANPINTIQMKKQVLLALLLVFLFTTKIDAQSEVQPKENHTVATYTGLNENVEFEFIDQNDKIYTFHEIGDEVDIDLFDETNFEKKFEITWVTQIVELLDEEGEPTGEKEIINEIISLIEK